MALFNVYHTKDWELNSKLTFAKKDLLKFYLPKWDNYKLVAGVTCESLGEVFTLTNHIEYEWWKNEGVDMVFKKGKCVTKGSRSTSVGDVVHNVSTGELFLCAPVGWVKLAGWSEDVGPKVVKGLKEVVAAISSYNNELSSYNNEPVHEDPPGV